ncbi:MAG: phosphate ABC transporter permease subunit PstC [Herpetosiphonaceae bacterium]|nr:phosphate ABC transporter permease subunit PstC [Herpetosiphonaceae bacterium]
MARRNAILAQSIFFSAAAILVLSTGALVLFIGSTGLRVFSFISPASFFFGRSWDQNTQDFGVLPLLFGSLATTLVTLVISAPLAIAVSIFMVEIAPRPIRRIMRTAVELFASLPSVIYGLLGLTLVVPWLRDALHVGLGKGILAAAVVLVFMTQPTMVSIAEDALRSLPESLREGALAVGATRWQMIWRVLVPAARPGLLTAVILGMGRAIGETMAVQMVVGNITSRIPSNLVSGATTMPAAIVTQLPEATSPAHRAALIMVAFLLLVITLILIAGVRLATGGKSTKASTRRAVPAAQGGRPAAVAKLQGDKV